ncbi:cation transporter [Benzoatithermus flavus]|uniref:Cation transporter n=1 Tax=Benzoatithermus flavus TaxID=3108223 RepID=A0ABU8XL32_9PROT
MRRIPILAITALGLLPAAGDAAERTVTLAVENMDCAACPYIVHKVMAAVPGVSNVAVSFEHKAAVVTFDDTRTTVEAVAAASANAGFPARPAGAGS